MRGGIPRFVGNESYSSSFGLQWRRFQRTQLDSFTGMEISRTRLERVLGGSLSRLCGARVLEAGCGAGRFTELLLDAGASVFAADLSTAVEANLDNCRRFAEYFVCQADIGSLPTEPAAFDVVVCVGVLQHTPNPEAAIAALCRQVKPGGLLALDHYAVGHPNPMGRRLLRTLLIRLPSRLSFAISAAAVATLWPFHRALWRIGRHPRGKRPRQWLLALSPVVDYHEAYPMLGPQLLRSWAMLDTHDAVTDVYRHLRTAGQLAATLRQAGMVGVEAVYAGNGVEVRARRP